MDALRSESQGQSCHDDQQSLPRVRILYLNISNREANDEYLRSIYIDKTGHSSGHSKRMAVNIAPLKI
jgi:hypothetical protein